MPQLLSSYSKCLFFFHLLLLFLSNSVTSTNIPHTKDFKVVWEKEQLFPSIHRVLTQYYFRYKMTEFDSIDPPTTPLPSTPITNPAVNTAPGIVTVPGTNPATNPVNPPVPVSNPVTTPTPTPVPSTNPPVPVSNPVTTPTPNPVPSTNPPVPVSNPVTTPGTNIPPTTPAGNGRGQSWCIAKNGASQAALQSALDYACGIGGADCATIQQGSSCYEPATLQNHASYAFNSYYQKNPVPTSCDFGGAAALTNTNPSTGSCVYQSSSSSSSSSTSTPTTPTTPTTQAPPTTATPTTPTTQAPANPTSLPAAPITTSPTSSSVPGSTFPGTQSPPPGFSMGNPDPTGLGAFGASPPLVNAAYVVSNNLVVSLIVVASVIMFGLLDC